MEIHLMNVYYTKCLYNTGCHQAKYASVLFKHTFFVLLISRTDTNSVLSVCSAE